MIPSPALRRTTCALLSFPLSLLLLEAARVATPTSVGGAVATRATVAGSALAAVAGSTRAAVAGSTRAAVAGSTRATVAGSTRATVAVAGVAHTIVTAHIHSGRFLESRT